MDAIVWLILAGIVTILLGLATFLQRRFFSTTDRPNGTEQPQARDGRRGVAVVAAGGVRRPQARNVRARLAALQRAREERAREREESDEEEEEREGIVEEYVQELVEQREEKKIGTKKMKRIQEKAERKAIREQEEAAREDQRRREALKDKERKKELEEERIRMKKEEEEERIKKEEEEKRELEEYLQLKENFVIEEEGLDAKDDETEARGIQDFIEYIKKRKVVFMEDLGAEFGLKTQDAISRVQSLQDSGELSGVVDDRGKFIYISEAELEAVAQFIKQRGRVSIAELVSSSNRLINLQQPDDSTITAS